MIRRLPRPMSITNASRICVLSALMATVSGCISPPEHKEVKYLKRGQEQLAKKDYSRALLEFKNAAQAMPKDPEPYYQSGLTYLATENIPGAVAAFRKATELNPKHAGAQLKLAELMTASRNKELVQDAEARLQNILAASPDNPEAIDTLAL